MSNIKVEMLTTSDFNHICRTCSSDGELKSLYDNIQTLSMLESITQMQFSRTDELPDKICHQCLAKINDCFHFINNCKIVDEGFRKCQTQNLKQLDVKTDELHSSIDIKEEYEPPEQLETIREDVVIDEPPKPETNENVKKIDVKQSEYYILKWGSPTEHPESKDFQVTVVNNSSNEQGLIEQEALKKQQMVNRLQKCRARHLTVEETRVQEKNKTIPVFSITNGTLDETMEDVALRRVTETNDISDAADTHRARAKLTLPHKDATTRHYLETQERIALQRAVAREQMRKLRAKMHWDDLDQMRAQATEYSRRQCEEPERLSEMAQSLLEPPKDPLAASAASAEKPRYSLRPTKIPQVKKKFYVSQVCTDDKMTKFRSWKRQPESPDDATVRLVKNTLQVKRYYVAVKDPMPVEQSALRRAKAAGQLRQYRPMLRKNNTAHAQTGK